MSLSVSEQIAKWREASRKYAKNHPERRKKYVKEHLESFAEWNRKWKKNNLEHLKDKAKERYKIDKDKIKVRSLTVQQNEKTNICSNCKELGRTEFHHLSYEPNIFVELCKTCHNKIHGRKTWKL